MGKYGNNFLVSAIGDQIVIGAVSPRKLSHDEATELAAWLVSLAYQLTVPFDTVLEEIQSS